MLKAKYFMTVIVSCDSDLGVQFLTHSVNGCVIILSWYCVLLKFAIYKCKTLLSFVVSLCQKLLILNNIC